MSAPERIFGIDGRQIPASQAGLPLTDLALRRGYGAFDFLRVEEGVPLFLDDHLVRFGRSAELLELTPRPNIATLKRHALDLIEANGSGRYGLQLFLTGGDGIGGFAPSGPRLVMIVVDLPSYPEDHYRNGVALLLHRYQRDLPEAKTTNYFTGVRLASTMRRAGAEEVLYHDGDRVLEASRCNLVLVDEHGTHCTPDADVLGGITLLNLERAARDHLPLRRQAVALAELPRFREAYLTSTTKGIMPVVRIGDVTLGDGRPGPETARAAAALAEHRDAWTTAFESAAAKEFTTREPASG